MLGPGMVPSGPSVSTPGSFRVALRPDGRVAAVADQTGPIRLYDTVTGDQLGGALSRHTAGARALEFSGDGSVLISGSSDGSVLVWDVSDPQKVGAPRVVFESGETAWALDISTDGRTLVVASDDGSLRLFDLDSLEQTAQIEWKSSSGIVSVAFSPDGRRLVASNRAGRLQSWMTSGGDALWDDNQQSEGPNLWEIVFSPDGTLFATAGDRDAAYIHDAVTGQAIPGAVFGRSPNSESTRATVHGIAFSVDGRRLIGGAADGTIHTWAIDDPADETVTTARHNGGVNHGDLSADGSVYVSVGEDKRLRVWQAPSISVSQDLGGFAEGAFGVAFDPTGQRMAVGDGMGGVHLLSIDGVSGAVTQSASISAHAGRVFDVEWAPDGSLLASIGDDGKVMLWDGQTAEAVATLGTHQGPGATVSFSPDGALLVSADRGVERGPGGSVYVWNVADRTLRAELPGHQQGVRTAEFSNDGDVIATADGRGEIRIWETQSLTLVRQWPANEQVNLVWALDFSSAGLLATVDSSEDLRVWDPTTGDQVGRPVSGLGTNGATGVGFDASGDTIAVVTRGGELHLVDWKQGVNLATSQIVAHPDAESFRLVFDSTGSKFATTGTDGVLRVWDLLSSEAACSAAGRRLDPVRDAEILGGAEPVGCANT
jgi:WD40 repeat protein